MENDKGIVPGKLSENYIFSQTFDQAGAGLESTGEKPKIRIIIKISYI